MEIQRRRKVALWHRLARAVHTRVGGELPVLHAAQRGELSERVVRLLTPQVCRRRTAVREAVLATLGVCVAIAPIAALQFVPRTENHAPELAVLELDGAEPDLAWSLVAAGDGQILVADSRLRQATPPLTGRFTTVESSLTALFDRVTPPGWHWSRSDNRIHVSGSEVQSLSLFDALSQSLSGEKLRTHSDGVTGVLYVPAQPTRSRALLWAGGLPHIVRVGEQVTGYGEVRRIDEEGVQLTSESGMLRWELRLRSERSNE